MAADTPGGDEGDHSLAALFSGAGEHFDNNDTAAWSVDSMYGDAPAEPDDFTTAWTAEESHVVSPYGETTAELTDAPIDLSFFHESTRHDLDEKPAHGNDAKPFTVANPANTVWVSAGIGGTTLRVNLSPTLVHITEAMLAEEICVLAGLARLKGQAGQRTLLLDAGVANTDDADLASPEQATAAQAEVFATRYGSGS
jgi:hypothetical protein